VLCPEAVERLPELLNGSLPSEPRAEVEAHLADCAPCREEWEETRQGALVFSAHLPTDALVALAWERPLPGLDPDLARRHLDACADCREDWALARESRSRERAEERLAPRRVPWALPASLAAGLAAVALVVGFALGSRRATHLAQADAARRQAVETAARLGAETDRLRQVESELRARLARLAAPRLNLPVLELLPGSTLTRGASSREPELDLGAEDTFAALVLSVPTDRRGLTAELRDARGRLLWKAAGLEPSSLGGYALAVPADLLPEGRLTLSLFADHGGPALARLPFRVRRTR
jgi:anti-sigma factor RsiW